jgi:hypothetical protein
LQGGPWRLTWCRHGYDPRTDPTAGRWQTIEFRAQAFELRKHLKLRAGDKNVVKFKEGIIPPHINCLYQAKKDLKVDMGENLIYYFNYRWVTLN